MPRTTPQRAATRIAIYLCAGAGLVAVGLFLLFAAWGMQVAASFGAAPQDSAGPAILGSVMVLAGLALLLVGLVAVGVRLGLTAHGVPSTRDAPAGSDSAGSDSAGP